MLGSVTREKAWETVSAHLRQEFGRLLDVRDVRRIRRVSGEGFKVTVVLAAPSGDLHVADLTLDETGAITPVLDGDAIIAAVRRAQTVSMLPPPPTDEMGGMDDFAAPEEDSLDNLEMMDDPAEVRIENALKRGDPASLREARDLLPRLLTDHEKRGATEERTSGEHSERHREECESYMITHSTNARRRSELALLHLLEHSLRFARIVGALRARRFERGIPCPDIDDKTLLLCGPQLREPLIDAIH
jgi:hypothetical protein